MHLRKCPACKNVVGTESYCCPRCGIDFRARRIRRAIMYLAGLALVAWTAHHYFIH